MGDSVMEDVKRRLFSKYLADAVPIAWETEEFEAVRQAFVEKNYSPHTSIPQEILISPVAYLSANPLFDDDKKHAETGHSKELLSELFLIQHLEYSEKVIKHTRKCYIADMTYYCQRNRDILRHLETRNDWYAREMVRWARAVKPLPVPTRKRTIVKYTRGWPGQLIFTRVNGGFWGSHEPYEEDRSRYSDLDIFGGEE